MTTLSDDGDTCRRCGGAALWEDCDQCGGEGEHDDLWELDPLNYDPGDTEPCEQCGGRGGWLVCLGTCGTADITKNHATDGAQHE